MLNKCNGWFNYSTTRPSPPKYYHPDFEILGGEGRRAVIIDNKFHIIKAEKKRIRINIINPKETLITAQTLSETIIVVK